ncbi:zinc finger CCHC domain-containing protein 9-like [Camellia sinensis]|uniref:zinc finger CCHC domain-containing protein 9-like n=1 Tax=Camellia sinensis TaxID=4442 RepID=UPI00103599D8|nr:zinc finger CCHC domain-containing protein 9-like [Camellia sinensis]
MKKMVNSDKNLQSSRYQIEEEENEELLAKPAVSPIVITICSDDEEADDEEATVDLSSKIVEKSMLRACNSGRQSDGVADEPKSNGAAVNSNAIDLSSSPSQEAELMADVKSKKNSRKVKKRKNKKVEKEDETVVVAMEEEKAKTSNALEINVPVEPNQVKISDNIVLRKLLRGPRYFDPPDNGWAKCYNCDGEGHAAVNCTSVKRKRPCYVCGSLEHHAKQCTKGQDCFICRKGSHRAKDCPEKYKRGSQNSKICLKCGDSSHDMFSCKNDYSPNDLEDIQCYICKNLGHLCCVDFTNNGPRELSCYRCGQLGHTGLVSLFNGFLFAGIGYILIVLFTTF